MFKFFINLIFVVNFVSSMYVGYKVYQIKPQTISEAQLLLKWQEKTGVDFWSKSRVLNQSSEVMIAPEIQTDFEKFLIVNNYNWKVAADDIDKILQSYENSRKHKRVPPKGQFSFDDFQRHHVMNDYLDQLAKDYPKYVIVKDEARTYENRVIKSIRISDGLSSQNKVTVVIDCGIHAREWIAPTFCFYLIKELTENRDNYLNILRKVNWLIVPLLNPDGYEYSHTENRLWRKTRRPDNENPSCFGTDGNRNYDIEWGGAGTSDNPCSDVFRGRKPFSEIETKMMGDLIIAESNANPGKVGYLTFHSYGYWLLYPWGYSATVPEPPFVHKLQRVCERIAKTVHKFFGGIYKYGSSAELLYPAAGGSDDFALAVAGIELSLTFELPPRAPGPAGFLLPPEKIISVCNETMVGVREFGFFLADNYLNS
uniref:Putative peptidase m14 carboxypeptidase subfamily protein n=1 Tax=Xenopsylla cheopis TaxID=163159 RepID=A0A6M2DYF7_XENCH